MKMEVLVAAMNQQDLSLHEKMNLKCDTIIANQCGRWGYDQQQYDYGTVKMISSDTVGVGKNRNTAINLSQRDIILFADDDMEYYGDVQEGVINAFRQLPDADVIFFSVDITIKGEIVEKRNEPIKKRYIWNSLKFGTYRIAVRKSAIDQCRIRFSTLFGGGCKYGSGEDTIFICDCFDKGLKVYSHSYVLGKCAKDTSTWFTGYNDKFFYDKGAFVACAFPKTKHLLKWYFAWRFKGKSKTDKSIFDIINLFNQGIEGYKTLKGYEERR